jgi:hypothetical protein
MDRDKIVLNLRIPKDVHEAAVQAAKARGVSLNTAILDAIAKSLEEQIIPEQLQGLTWLLMLAMDIAGRSRLSFDQLLEADQGPRWLDDPDGFEAAAAAATTALEAVKPRRAADFAGDAAGLAKHNRADGRRVAEQLLDRVMRGEGASRSRAAFLRQHLGHLVDRIQIRPLKERWPGFEFEPKPDDDGDRS